MIFGRRISRHYRGKLQTEIEDMDLPNPVIRSHYGNGFVKQYVRDHLILRTEAASNNVNDYGVNKSVQNLPALRNALSAINDNYLNVQQDIVETFIDRGHTAVEDGMGWANIELKKRKDTPPLYCVPDGFGLTGEQILEILRKEAKENPSSAAKSYGLVMLETLEKVFPCNK